MISLTPPSTHPAPSDTPQEGICQVVKSVGKKILCGHSVEKRSRLYFFCGIL